MKYRPPVYALRVKERFAFVLMKLAFWFGNLYDYEMCARDYDKMKSDLDDELRRQEKLE